VSILFECAPVERRPRSDRATTCSQCREEITARSRVLRVVTLDVEPYQGFAWFYVGACCSWAWPPEADYVPARRSTRGHDHRPTWRRARAIEHARC